MSQQQAPAVQNTRLLLVAGVLGVVVAVTYNIHIAQVRRALRGQSLMLIRSAMDIRVGEKITEEMIEQSEVPERYAQSLQDVITWSDSEKRYLVGQVANRPINKGEFIQWAHITQDDPSRRPSAAVTSGMASHTLYVDPRNAPGELLRTGDYVDLYGMFPVDGKLQTLRILEGARVIEAGGRVAKARMISGVLREDYEEGQSSLKKIAVEVSPEVSRKLWNVTAHATLLAVDLRSPHDRDTFAKIPPGPQLSREVAPFAESAPVGGRGGAETILQP